MTMEATMASIWLSDSEPGDAPASDASRSQAKRRPAASARSRASTPFSAVASAGMPRWVRLGPAAGGGGLFGGEGLREGRRGGRQQQKRRRRGLERPAPLLRRPRAPWLISRRPAVAARPARVSLPSIGV
jgi:hypothetical protein